MKQSLYKQIIQQKFNKPGKYQQPFHNHYISNPLVLSFPLFKRLPVFLSWRGFAVLNVVNAVFDTGTQSMSCRLAIG